MISVQCSQCGKSYKVKESAVGKQVKCKCGQSFVVKPKDSESTTNNNLSPPIPSPSDKQARPKPQTSVSPFASPPPNLPAASQSEQSALPKVETERQSVTSEKVEIKTKDLNGPPSVSVGSESLSTSQRYARKKNSIAPLLIWGGGGLLVVLLIIVVIMMGPGSDANQQTAEKEKQANNKPGQTKQSNEKKKRQQKSTQPRPERNQDKKENASKGNTATTKKTNPAKKEQDRKGEKGKTLDELPQSPVFMVDRTIEISLPEWKVPDLSPEEAITQYATPASLEEKERYEEALIRHGEKAVAAVVAKVKIADKDPAAKYGMFQLCRILSKIGQPAVKSLTELAEDESLKANTRAHAMRFLGDMGPIASSAIDKLTKVFNDNRPGGITDLKLSALGALGGIGIMTKEVEAIFNEVLINEGEKYRDTYATVALKGVKNMGPAAGVLVPAIRPYLLCEKQQARDAAEALGAIGPDAGPAAAEFVKLIEGDDKIVSYRTFHALRDIGQTADQSVPALIKSLKDTTNNFERGDIADALGRMGPSAQEALPTLEQYLVKDEAERFGQAQRIIYRVAIDRIRGNPTASIPYLRAALTDNKHNARTEAVKQIGYLGPQAKALIPDLADIILNINTKEAVVYIAIQALGKMGKDGADGVGTLIAFINREHENPKGQKTYRLHAMDALANINSDARIRRGLQRIASHDPSSNTREKAARLIQKLDAG